jgi:hypothetical protein
MKNIFALLFIFLTNFLYAQSNIQDNLQNGLRTELIDSTLTLIHNIIIKSKDSEIKRCMDKAIVINSANQLLNNPYSKINDLLDKPYSKNNQFDKKNIKKLIIKLKTSGDIEFWKITVSAINDYYYIIVNPLRVVITSKNKVYVQNFNGLAISCFKFNKSAKTMADIKNEWELISFDLSSGYKL